MPDYLQRESNKITLANFYEAHKLGKYNYSPPYQRRSIWTDEKKSFLIDSILKNYPMPPIFLHQKIDDVTGNTVYDVIDGKQRLMAILDFIDGKIPSIEENTLHTWLQVNIHGTRFDLDPTWYGRFMPLNPRYD